MSFPTAGHFGSSQYPRHHAGILYGGIIHSVARFRSGGLSPLSPNQTAEDRNLSGRNER